MIPVPLDDALLFLEAMPPTVCTTPELGAAWDRLYAQVQLALRTEPRPPPPPVDFDEEIG